MAVTTGDVGALVVTAGIGGRGASAPDAPVVEVVSEL